MSDRLQRGRLLPIIRLPMSAAPPPTSLLDALAEPAALLEPGTLRVLFANRRLRERAPEAVGALPPFTWWPDEAAVAVAGEIAAPDGGAPVLLAVFRESGAALDRALRHVATAVAANAGPSEVFELVATTARELLGAGSAGVVRYEGPTHGRVMGQAGVAMPNRRFTLLGENCAAVTACTGVPTYVKDFALLHGRSRGGLSRWASGPVSPCRCTSTGTCGARSSPATTARATSPRARSRRWPSSPA